MTAEQRPEHAEPAEELSSIVRPYAWTGGRTRAAHKLEMETLVSTSVRADEAIDTLRSEHQSVARLCRRSMSVAEVGALLSLPLGVVRVLLDDMAGLGLVDVHRTRTGPDERPDLELLARVRRGLANLGS
jgi:DNA-directed RNA polymerase specialized sigma24 family protein